VAANASKIALVHLVRQLERWGLRHDRLPGCNRTPGIGSEHAKSRAPTLCENYRIGKNYPGAMERWILDDDLAQ
jgi:hypothetical protein